MANHSSNSLEMPLRLSAFSNVLPQSSVDNRLVESALPNLSAIAEAPGSLAHVRRGHPNEETDYRSSCRCQAAKEAQATKKTRGRDLVAE